MLASGVAALTASAPVPWKGSTQLFISSGKLAMMTMRPMRAGLTKLWPSPPNICLATTMAATPPRAACHKGMVAGRLKASSSPVTTADKSPTVWGRFMTRRLKNSAATQEPTDTAMTAAARHPNSQTEAAAAGIRAMITSSMMLGVSMPQCRWGDDTTVNFDFSIRVPAFRFDHFRSRRRASLARRMV